MRECEIHNTSQKTTVSVFTQHIFWGMIHNLVWSMLLVSLALQAECLWRWAWILGGDKGNGKEDRGEFIWTWTLKAPKGLNHLRNVFIYFRVCSVHLYYVLCIDFTFIYFSLSLVVFPCLSPKIVLWLQYLCRCIMTLLLLTLVMTSTSSTGWRDTTTDLKMPRTWNLTTQGIPSTCR